MQAESFRALFVDHLWTTRHARGHTLRRRAGRELFVVSTRGLAAAMDPEE